MPIIRELGDGRFLWEPDEQQGAGPGAVKRQTAEQYAYSPEARQRMEDIDIRLTAPRPPFPDPDRPAWMKYPVGEANYGAGAWYNRPLGRKEARLRITSPRRDTGQLQNAENLLAHEFAHDYYRTAMPEESRQLWESQGRTLISPEIYDQAVRSYYRKPATGPEAAEVKPSEVYADIARQPRILVRMDPWVRQAAFPYLDQEEWDRRHAAWASSWPSEAERAQAAFGGGTPGLVYVAPAPPMEQLEDLIGLLNIYGAHASRRADLPETGGEPENRQWVNPWQKYRNMIPPLLR